MVRWVNADLVNHIVQLITLQANRLCCRRLMGLEGYAVGLKKSLRHHPQGHNNTSSHAHDEVDTMLHLRCAAVVCLLLPNLSCLVGALQFSRKLSDVGNIQREVPADCEVGCN